MDYGFLDFAAAVMSVMTGLQREDANICLQWTDLQPLLGEAEADCKLGLVGRNEVKRQQTYDKA